MLQAAWSAYAWFVSIGMSLGLCLCRESEKLCFQQAVLKMLIMHFLASVSQVKKPGQYHCSVSMVSALINDGLAGEP